MREALLDFWRLDLQPALPANEREIGSESLWFNHSFDITIEWRLRKYFSDVLEVNLVSDIIDGSTGKPFTRRDWIKFVHKMQKKRSGGISPDNAFSIERGEAMLAAAQQRFGFGMRCGWTCGMDEGRLTREDVEVGDDAVLGVVAPGTFGSAIC